MFDHDDGGSPGLNLSHQFHGLGDLGVVETFHYFIQQQQFGSCGQGPGHFQSFLVGQSQILGRRVRQFLQADELQQLASHPGCVMFRDLFPLAEKNSPAQRSDGKSGWQKS